MHALKSRINVDQLKERIRSEVLVNKKRLNTVETEIGDRRLDLDRDQSFSEVLQFHLHDAGPSPANKLESLREQAREKTVVSRWIPKPFRRWFRKQGDFNKLVLESLRVVEKNQHDLLKENSKLRAYLSAHYYWFRDFVERRVEDRAMINALHARGAAHERTSSRLQVQIDRQAEALHRSGQFANSILEQLELQMKQADDLNVKSEAIDNKASELRRRLEEEKQLRAAAFAEVIAKLEEEMQARRSALAELSTKIDHEIAANRTLSSDLAEQHSQLAGKFNEMAGKATEMEHRFTGEAQAMAALRAEHDKANASWAAGLSTLGDSLRRFDERQLNESAYIKSELSLQRQLLHDQRPPGARTPSKKSTGNGISEEGPISHRFDAFYLAFENRFRGSRAEIKARFAYYLPHLARLPGAKHTIRLLDVGCGRGEWMELLKENRYSKVSGVDSNLAMAAQCRERDLKVVVQDGIEHVSSLKAASLNVITAFHVIEHLPFEQLVQFLAQCRRTLKQGGMLILETPNPDNLIVGAKNFYTDPTHLRPLPSVLTSFLTEHVGFSDVNTFNLHPFSPDMFVKEEGELATRFNELFCSEQDYAIIARKP